jgi:predicted DNA-binding protein with PD1-like motif
MKYSEAELKRVFVVRLEDGEVLHEQIEELAVKEKINSAVVIAVGAADAGSTLVVGPEKDRGLPINPLNYCLEHAHEVCGTGTIFLNAEDRPILHMHIACGREDKTHTGCIRCGVIIWHVLEVIIFELTGSSARRLVDKTTGFELLQP